MSDIDEFTDLLKEAFVGEEPFDPSPGMEALQASVAKFERRMRTVRHMAWFAVTFMGGVMAWAAYSFFQATPDDTDLKTMLVYAVLFGMAFLAVGFIKGWFAMMSNDIGLRKELKRTQMMLLESRERA